MHSKDSTEMFRAQGSVGVIDTISKIQQDCRDYLRDVAEGKIKPLKDGQ